MNTYTIIIIIVAVVIIGGLYFYWAGRANTNSNNSAVAPIEQEKPIKKSVAESSQAPQILIETNRGNITIELYKDDAPKTVENFVKLANEKFYDGIKFHRVIKGFMIQGGDPLTKDDSQINRWGTGGPGYQFADELNPATKSFQAGYKRGVVAMANAGPNTNGSQFFIMHTDYPLPNNYTIFGKVVSGIETVDAIANSPTDQNDRSKSPIVITRVTIE
ncbi:MAG: peptidylprolyl isomerase [Patescibacteria group bacterium]